MEGTDEDEDEDEDRETPEPQQRTWEPGEPFCQADAIPPTKTLTKPLN